jgi:hypothetical protein
MEIEARKWEQRRRAAREGGRAGRGKEGCLD